MVIGDPNKFAIVIDVVDEWSTNGFVSGIFYISIDGCLFPKDLLNTTLNSEIYIFFENEISSLLTKPVDIELFEEDKLTVYKRLLDITFPEISDDVESFPENNYLYSCGFNEIENAGCYLFSVSNGEQVRILGAEVVKDGTVNRDGSVCELSVCEVFISIAELDSIIQKFRRYYHDCIVAQCNPR
ncbi:immunity 42 family protein [Lonsdalea quercina]|uniref:immunity 42 family protein n=1 Tax=Lonsdalea quercina TaxID=71657 RepID=UPI0039758D82